MLLTLSAKYLKQRSLLGVMSLVGCYFFASACSRPNSNYCEQAAQIVADCTGEQLALAPADCSGDLEAQSAQIVEKGCAVVNAGKEKADDGSFGFLCNPEFDWLNMCKFISEGEGNRVYVQSVREFLPGGYYYGKDKDGEDCTVAVHIPNFMGALDWSVNSYRETDAIDDGMSRYYDPLYVFNLSTVDYHRLMEFKLTEDELIAVTRINNRGHFQFELPTVFEEIRAVKKDGQMTVVLPGFTSERIQNTVDGYRSVPTHTRLNCTFDFPAVPASE